MHEQQTISREDPMFDHVESIDFSATFCFTGEFAFGDRKACEQATAQLGATVKPRPLFCKRGLPCGAGWRVFDGRGALLRPECRA